MTTTQDTSRWTPITKPGGIYCSPGCGFNCTKENHDEAQRLGAALAERMGPGWKAHVWENGMWHYAVNFDWDGPAVRLHHGYEPGKARDGHREGIDEYTCYLNTQPQFIGKSTDPRQAFELALAQLDEHTAVLNEAVTRLRATCKALST